MMLMPVAMPATAIEVCNTTRPASERAVEAGYARATETLVAEALSPNSH